MGKQSKRLSGGASSNIFDPGAQQSIEPVGSSDRRRRQRGEEGGGRERRPIGGKGRNLPRNIRRYPAEVTLAGALSKKSQGLPFRPLLFSPPLILQTGWSRGACAQGLDLAAGDGE